MIYQLEAVLSTMACPGESPKRHALPDAVFNVDVGCFQHLMHSST